MSKAGDVIVKLVLKNEEYEKNLKKSKKSTETFGSGMSKALKAASAAWAVLTAAVVKFCSDAINMTERWGDKWAEEMAGIKGAYGAFIRQLSSGEGWDNLIANMREAKRVAKEVAASMDEIFERKTSLSYKEAEINKVISEQQLIMRDTSKSDAERAAAADLILRKEEELRDLKKDIYQQQATDQKALFMSQTQLNEEQTDFLVKNYNENRQAISEARAYNDEREKSLKRIAQLEKSMMYSRDPAMMQHYSAQIAEETAGLAALDNATNDTIKNLAELTRKYDKGNDELVKNMAEAEVAVINLDTEANNAMLRANSTLGRLNEAASKSANTSPVFKVDEDVFSALQDEADAMDDLSARLVSDFEKINGLSGAPFNKEIAEIAGIAERVAYETESAFQQIADNATAFTEKMEDIANMLVSSVENGIVRAIDELAESIGSTGAIDTGAFVKALLSPLADVAVEAGLLIMTTGEAIEALKDSFIGFFGGNAIAAGATLMAIGAAAKMGLAAIGRGQSSAAGTATTEAAASTASYGGIQDIELTVNLEGTLKGSDIVLAARRTENNWNR